MVSPLEFELIVHHFVPDLNIQLSLDYLPSSLEYYNFLAFKAH